MKSSGLFLYIYVANDQGQQARERSGVLRRKDHLGEANHSGRKRVSEPSQPPQFTRPPTKNKNERVIVFGSVNFGSPRSGCVTLVFFLSFRALFSSIVFLSPLCDE